MGCTNGESAPVNQFALVSYIPDPLGGFLDQLRLELVPGCSPHAHVTILPPRPIRGSQEQAVQEIVERAQDFSEFEVELGSVELFPISKVVYLSLKRGEPELREMYRILNHGTVEFRESFPYHPHITLAQNFDPGEVERLLELSRRQWSSYNQTRMFVVDSLDFVKNLFGYHWTDLASFPLKRAASEVTA